MALIPFKQFNIERFFDEEWIKSIEEETFKTPKIDLYETEKEITAEIEIPGVDPKNINVEVGTNSLKLEAKKEEKKQEKQKGYFKKEISSGYYKRIVALPDEVVKEKVDATYTDGILKIIMPKVTKKKVTKIKIK